MMVRWNDYLQVVDFKRSMASHSANSHMPFIYISFAWKSAAFIYGVNCIKDEKLQAMFRHMPVVAIAEGLTANKHLLWVFQGAYSK